jgi:AraC family transcriptional regulator
MLDVQIKSWPGANLVAIEHRGDYNQIASCFERLIQVLSDAQVEYGACVGVFPDDPMKTPEMELRSFAAAMLPPGKGLEHPDLLQMDIPPVECLSGVHLGPYDGLDAAWSEMFSTHLPSFGREASKMAPWEVYLNDCAEVSPEELRTEIWIPLA